ncbi:MAG TPA: ABC transporter ATP-binding protein, partial [Alphaproteobacteria bacterium]|nr:ABC transporter ATP-binding protein [Alphaproteobacteria bacterium]
DRIAIMNAGKIIQIATPAEMYRNPATQFVAGFLGNPPIAFIRGKAQQGAFAGAGVRLPLVNSTAPVEGQPLTLGIRPEDFGPHGDVPIPGRIVFVESQGRENLYDVALPDGSVLRSIQPVHSDVKVGDEVHWAVARDKIMVFAEDGRRL